MKEMTVQLENHRKITCYKKGRKPRYKPRPKHPIKVHVWGGISHRGQISVTVFEGKMNARLFMEILDDTLVPFIKDVYPDGCHLVRDNVHKHSSRAAHKFYEERKVDWKKRPQTLILLNVSGMSLRVHQTKSKTKNKARTN